MKVLNFRNWTDCKAVYNSGDGYKYSGEWKNGQQNGKGIEMWDDGRKYVGELYLAYISIPNAVYSKFGINSNEFFSKTFISKLNY